MQKKQRRGLLVGLQISSPFPDRCKLFLKVIFRIFGHCILDNILIPGKEVSKIPPDICEIISNEIMKYDYGFLKNLPEDISQI